MTAADIEQAIIDVLQNSHSKGYVFLDHRELLEMVAYKLCGPSYWSPLRWPKKTMHRIERALFRLSYARRIKIHPNFPNAWMLREGYAEPKA